MNPDEGKTVIEFRTNADSCEIRLCIDEGTPKIWGKLRADQRIAILAYEFATRLISSDGKLPDDLSFNLNGQN